MTMRAARFASFSHRIGVVETPTAVTSLRTASVRKCGRKACSPTLTMSSGQALRITAFKRLASATAPVATRRSASRSVATGAVAEANRLNAVIRNAWPEDMVSVGEHAFLPHFRTEAVRQLVTAVGISPSPIRWEKDPHRTARIVILIVAPPRETPTYLQVVGAFARALSNPETVLSLLAAKTPEQVVAL